jgi:hypothetical protein
MIADCQPLSDGNQWRGRDDIGRMAAPRNSGKMTAMRWNPTTGAILAAAIPWLAAACAGGEGAEIDPDADGGADAALDCSSYPAGPYDWDLDEVVSMEQFSAVHGSGGAPTVLDMCDVFLGADAVKSVVFVIGTTTCAYCPERFTEIGAVDLAAYGAEKAAVYYNDQTANTNIDAATTSGIVDSYGWIGGWRISDTDAQVIFNGGYPDWLWVTTPNVFVLDTHTMRIVAAEKGAAPTQLDVLAEVRAIDEAYP